MRVKYYYDHKQFHKPIVCNHCGRKFWNHGWAFSPLAEFANKHGVCLECAKWLQFASKRQKGVEVIDGVVWRILPKQEKRYGAILGGKGKNVYILKKDGTAIESNDIWQIGTVPELFRERIPDTAYWVTDKKMGKRLVSENFQCEGRQCYDRYHCYRYDYTQEFEDGPFNKIPKDWVVGNERCGSFINIQCIAGYDYYNINDILNYETEG